MNDLKQDYQSLNKQLELAMSKLQIEKQQTELEKLKDDSQQPDFWQDGAKSQTVMKRIASLENRLKPWQKVDRALKEVKELLDTDDQSLHDELALQLSSLEGDIRNLKELLKLAGPYDDRDAIISIHAGAGGTDAQDWAQMLQRMYLRWAEKNQFKSIIVDESVGEEAGIKSVTIEVDGDFAYGKLKGEHGVHRLVRLSPFNSDHLRQTSFAKVEVMPKIDSPDEIEIDDKDLKIDVYRSGGRGGQSVNTTDSAVRVTHLPTNISVAIQNERSQLQNKDTAMTILRSRLAGLQLEQHKEHLTDLKGPNQSAEWGNQIRNYVLHPYKQVKDLRSHHESSDPDSVLDGGLNPFIEAYLEATLGK